MELTVKEKKIIAVIVLISIVSLILMQPIFSTTNNTESDQVSGRTLTQNNVSSSHGKFIITVNSSSICPNPPCDGWW